MSPLWRLMLCVLSNRQGTLSPLSEYTQLPLGTGDWLVSYQGESMDLILSGTEDKTPALFDSLLGKWFCFSYVTIIDQSNKNRKRSKGHIYVKLQNIVMSKKDWAVASKNYRNGFLYDKDSLLSKSLPDRFGLLGSLIFNNNKLKVADIANIRSF